MKTKCGRVPLVTSFLLALLAFGGGALGVPGQGEASAAEPAPFALEGRYVLAAPEEAATTLREALKGAVRRFPLLVRPFARARLGRIVRASETMMFAVGQDSITIRSDNGQDWTTDLRRTEVTVTDRWGEPVTLSRWMDGRNLYDHASQGSGSSMFEFRPSDDGSTFTLAVVTSSPRLKAPIRYEVQYRRE